VKSIINYIKIVNPGFIENLSPWVRCYGNRRERTLYLTFDDGPHPEFTPAILDLLDKYNVKSMFFLVGSKVEEYPEIAREILNRGHAVGNHGYFHKSLLFKSLNFIEEEIRKTDDAVMGAVGSRPVFFRPPYGRFDLRFGKIMKKTGHSLVLWSLLSYDFSGISSESIFKIVRKNVVHGSVIVLHDGLVTSRITIETIPMIVQYLLNEGYTFSVLEE